MNAQAILIRIEEDAIESAARLQDEAKARAVEMKAASRAKIEGMHSALLKQAEKDSAQLEQRMLRMAELDDRKTFLANKRGLIDQAFSLAYEKLLAAPAADKRAFFLRQVVRFATGVETLTVGVLAADWFDADFVGEANRALVTVGKPGTLTLAAQRRADCAGVTLAADGSEIRCTFEAFLEELRPELEQSVAAELFQTP